MVVGQSAQRLKGQQLRVISENFDWKEKKIGLYIIHMFQDVSVVRIAFKKRARRP